MKVTRQDLRTVLVYAAILAFVLGMLGIASVTAKHHRVNKPTLMERIATNHSNLVSSPR